MDFPQRLIFFLLSGLLLCNPVHADSRLLATSGVTQLEGSAGRVGAVGGDVGLC